MGVPADVAGPDERSQQQSDGATPQLLSLSRYPLRQWPRLLAILLLSGFTALLAALQPLPLRLLVDSAIGDEPPSQLVIQVFSFVGLEPSAIALVLVAAAAAFVLTMLVNAVEASLDWTWEVAGQRMVYDLAGDLFARLQRLSLGFHRRRPIGDSLDRLSVDTWAIYTATNAVLIAPLLHVLTIVIVGWAAWRLNPALALLLLAIAPLLAIAGKVLGHQIQKRTAETRTGESQQAALVHQVLDAAPLVQSYTAEARTRALFTLISGRVVRAARRQAAFRALYDSTGGLISALGTALVLVVGGLQVLDGSLTLGALLVFLAYLVTLKNAAQGLLSTHGSLQSAMASLHRVVEVLEVEDEVRDPVRPVALAAMGVGEQGGVVVDSVTVEYEPGRAVLVDVSVEVGSGQTVALVGSTGAGKSTLVSLVPRFLDPVRGRVLVDGVDVRRLRLAELRQHVALVRQDPLLLPVSVADNIAYGRPGADRDEIEAAAAAANADEFINALPEGYGTVLGERGATLSGGQRQRIAIARALLKNAPVLILDEPTSALDVETEAQLIDTLQRLMQGRTTFLITHRLSAIRQAHHIVVLEHGRVAEQGTHDQLIVANGRYHHLRTLQTSPTQVGATVPGNEGAAW